MEGPFKITPVARTEIIKAVNPVEGLTVSEKLQLEAHLDAIMRLKQIDKPTVASLLTEGVLVDEIKGLLNKIKVSTSIEEVLKALKRDLEQVKGR